MQWDDKVCSFEVETTTASRKINGVTLVETLNAQAITAQAQYVNTDEKEDGKNDATVVFDATPSTEDKAIIESIIAAHTDAPQRARLKGSERFELSVGTKKWTRHQRRVTFAKTFPDSPTVKISNSEFDGAAELSVTKTTKTYFDFVVQSRGMNKNKSGSAGLTSVTFDWEATL